jgi:hypothetical protein
MTRTEWFPHNVEPVHVGWYERRHGYDWPYMAWWNGECFTTGARNALIYSHHYKCEWRGLTERAA